MKLLRIALVVCALPLMVVPVATAGVEMPDLEERDASMVRDVRLVAHATPRPVSEQPHANHILTSVWVSDRRSKRMWTLRTGLMLLRGKWGTVPAAGRRILNLSVNSREVAWIEETVTSASTIEIGVWTQQLLPSTGPARRITTRTYRRSDLDLQDDWVGDVAVLGDGSLAWVVDRGRVWLKRPGHAPFAVSPKGVVILRLGVDDGRTLWWLEGREWIKSRVVLRDLLPPRRSGGCPVRSRYRRYFAGGGVVATKAPFLSDWGWSSRYCDLETGVEQPTPGGLTVQGAQGDFMLLLGFDGTDGCWAVHAASYDRRSRRVVRMAAAEDGGTTILVSPGALAPSEGNPEPCDPFADRPSLSAFTASGAVAWVISDLYGEGGDKDALFAIRGGREPRIVLLDGGHDITDLAGDGDRFTWNSDGVPRAGPA